MDVTVCNPLLRTPLSLIVDDSCPVINNSYYWIRQRQAWLAKHEPDTPRPQWPGYGKVDTMCRVIPAAFAAEWGDWCGENGIRGKFSLIPFPAGYARVDESFPGYPRRELDEWLRVYREVIHPNFDITPEMLTHSHVVDLKTWKLIEEWEQGEWVDPPVEPLTEYIATSMQLLRNIGIACEGVTSPGAFGKLKEEPYARATLDASLAVNNNPRPFYFLHVEHRDLPSVPIWHADRERGRAVASIVACAGDWFGGWTGWHAGSADQFITEDLCGGRLSEVLAQERPCVLVGHWAGFYYEGERVGFDILKEVKRRLDAYDPDGTRIIWLKNSEIGHYWMAREHAEINVSDAENGGFTARISTAFPTERFTLALGCRASRVRVGSDDLRQVSDRRVFASGTYLVEGDTTFAAFDLAAGTTTVTVTR